MPRTFTLNTLLRWCTQGRGAAALALLLMGAGCAVPQWQKPGTPQQQVLQAWGTPHERVALPEGGERWVYSRQPMGQQVFHVHIDGQQRLQGIEQVLTPAHFQRLRTGQDTAAVVRGYFGRPAMVEGVASFVGDIWTYRIHDLTIDRMAHVFIDPHGTVQRVMFTDEPSRDDDPRR